MTVSKTQQVRDITALFLEHDLGEGLEETAASRVLLGILEHAGLKGSLASRQSSISENSTLSMRMQYGVKVEISAHKRSLYVSGRGVIGRGGASQSIPAVGVQSGGRKHYVGPWNLIGRPSVRMIGKEAERIEQGKALLDAYAQASELQSATTTVATAKTRHRF